MIRHPFFSHAATQSLDRLHPAIAAVVEEHIEELAARGMTPELKIRPGLVTLRYDGAERHYYRDVSGRVKFVTTMR